MRTLALATLLLSATACADARTGGPLAVADVSARPASWRVDLKDARADLLAAEAARAAAVRANVVDGFAGAMLPDAYMLPTRVDILQGPDAARAYLQSSVFFAAADFSPVRADVSADGSAGYTLSFGTTTRRDNGATVYLRMITFWRHTDAGWKVAAFVPGLFLIPHLDVPAAFGTPTDNGVQGAPASAGAGELENVLQADRDFAAMAQPHDAQAAFVAFAAPTAMLIGGPTFGRDQISEAFAGGGPDDSLEWAPVAGGVADSGDLGFTVGLAVSRFRNPDGTMGAGYTKYLTIWQRQPNGRWLYVADGGTSRPAPR